MSSYLKATDFASKDALLSGDPQKIVKGTEIDDELNAIQTAVNSKADSNNAVLTGTPIAPTAAVGTNTTQIATTAFVLANSFPSGTAMLFVQTAAPTGWTKSTTHNDKALRVVSGTASNGGSVAFSSAFASPSLSGTVGNTTLTIDQIPAHTHTINYNSGSSGSGSIFANSAVQNTVVQNTYVTNSSGGGGSHTHSFSGTATINVQYVDVIICTKD